MVIVAILAVSIDAYVAGLSVGYGRAGELKILYISAFSFILPLLFMTAALAEDWLNTAAACILIVLGFKGLIENEKVGLIKRDSLKKMSYAEATLLGISLSADSVFGSAIFTGEVSAPLICAAIFCAQYVMLALGRFTSRLRNWMEAFSGLASLVLIMLGISRLM